MKDVFLEHRIFGYITEAKILDSAAPVGRASIYIYIYLGLWKEYLQKEQVSWKECILFRTEFEVWGKCFWFGNGKWSFER